MKVGIFLLFSLLIFSATAKIQLTFPVKAIYIDIGINWNAPEQTFKEVSDAGFNLIILAFYLSASGPTDAAIAWQSLSEATKQSTINYIHSKGGIVLVSAGGETDIPYGIDPVIYGTKVGAWAASQLLDGVDFDLENFAPFVTYPPYNSAQMIDWISNATVAAKSQMGSDSFITHAPQAPYIGKVGSTVQWAGPLGGYTAVYLRNPSIIDFFLVQFYNQGSCYTDYNSLFVNSVSISSCSFPGTSVMEMVSFGIPATKIVVGKPMLTSDAGSGYVSPSNLNSFFKQAKQQFNYNTGVMTWQHHSFSTDQTWIQTVYGAPSNFTTSTTGATTGATTTTTTTSSSTTGFITTSSSSTTGASTTTGGGGNCCCSCVCSACTPGLY